MKRSREVEQSPFMTADEIALRLGIHANTVYVYAKAGQIPGERVGRRWFFKRGVIEQWLRNGGLEGGPVAAGAAPALPTGVQVIPLADGGVNIVVSIKIEPTQAKNGLQSLRLLGRQ